MADYDNTNRFSLWARDKGPVTYTGFINVEGTEYSLKFLRLAKEQAKGALIVEDKDKNYALVGSGFLYPSKFDMLLSGKLTVRGTEYYVNFYKSKGNSEKSPTFSGSIKPVSDTPNAEKSSPAPSTEDDW